MPASNLNNINLIHSIRFFSFRHLQGALIFGNQNPNEILKIFPPMPNANFLFNEIQEFCSKPIKQKMVFKNISKNEILDIINDFCSQGTPLFSVFDSNNVRIEGLSVFQLAVYREACKIPLGETQPYSWLATKLKKFSNGRTAARAVGQALKKNPFPLLIPCHRVVQKNGEIGGFMGAAESESWQISLKKALLDLEGLYRQPDFFTNEVSFQKLLA